MCLEAFVPIYVVGVTVEGLESQPLYFNNGGTDDVKYQMVPPRSTLVFLSRGKGL